MAGIRAIGLLGARVPSRSGEVSGVGVGLGWDGAWLEAGGLAELGSELVWLGLLVVSARLLWGCRWGGHSPLLAVPAPVS